MSSIRLIRLIRPSAMSLLLLVFVALIAFDAHAQYGGGRRGGGMGGPGGEGNRNSQKSDNSGAKNAIAPISDPMAPIERELPSLRLDLKLTPEQAALFDSFERQVRNAAEAARQRTRHLAAFRYDDGSTLSAASVFSTIQEDDAARAEAVKRAIDGLESMYASFNADQRRQFDRRIMQALRDPLGAS